MKLDARRSAAFLAAVDCGSLELAASQLNITPSAVSQRISALEQDLGRVVACVTGEPAPLHGCTASALGVMRYRLVASPAFARRWFPDGFSRSAALHAPVMVFDRKDPLQSSFLLQHFGLPEGAYPFHYVPASDPYVNAIRAGMGYGLLPLEQCAALLESGELVDLTPHLHVDVPLYWHAWRIQPPRLERMGAALVKAARGVLLPIGHH